ncbi:MAG: hypothetical protein OXT74_15320, partial [Candidatus Poribacteria bacterium]|nr:hypothetical protein [Candidatus Poribacteria bacterium]
MYTGFNSILVRLKQAVPTLKEFAEKTFQFHTGSIKTSDKYAYFVLKSLFQFHTGSIKTLMTLKLI